MSEWRGLAAVIIFVIAYVAIGHWWGRIGLVGAGAMMLVMWAAIGLLTGWWIGRDSEHDDLIAELSHRLKLRRERLRDTSADFEPPSE